MTDRKNLFILLLMGSVLAFGSIACGEDEEPEASGAECTADEDCPNEGEICGDGGTCELPPADCTVDEDCDEGETCNDDGECVADGPECTEDTDCGEGQTCNDEGACEDDGPAPFRFVIVEDLVANPSGDFPGTDTDAIGLTKGDGTEIFAASVGAATDIDCTGNLACDSNALLGAPDAINPETGECFGGGDPDGTLFTALNGGSVVVQFSSIDNGDVTIENGDSIHVYEVGAAECGRFDDDAFRVSVSIADDISGDLTVLGDLGEGNNIIDVTGLP